MTGASGANAVAGSAKEWGIARRVALTLRAGELNDAMLAINEAPSVCRLGPWQGP